MTDFDPKEQIEQIVTGLNTPDLTVIGPLAKKMGITSVRALFDLYDDILRRWNDHRSYRLEGEQY